MSKTTLSPLYNIEEIVYQKLKDKKFKTWHYIVALAFLTIIPTIVSAFLSSDIAFLVIAAVVSVAWLLSRVFGRNLSRNKGMDSVLIYRYFAAVPWLVSTIATGVTLMINRIDSLTHLFYSGFFWISLVVLAVHILGIIVHHFKSKKMIKNIKKDELFQ